MSILAEKLSKKLEKELRITGLVPEIMRTRAGKWQKAAGAFLWFMLDEKGCAYGSCEKATTVLKAKKITLVGTYGLEHHREYEILAD